MESMRPPPSAPPAVSPLKAASSAACPDDGAARERGWRVRWRKYLAASMLGVAVVVAPAWPTAAQERASRRPPFERALSWRDFIRMRLSPWLLLQQTSRPADEFGES
jgi:hypothetical protein